MPLYEYQCKKCGHRFEKIQSFSAEPIKECPICCGEVERLLSAPAVQFKGSGFYSTDYAAKSAKSSQGSDSTPAKAATDGASASSDKSSGTKAEPSSAQAPASKSAD